MDIYEKIKNNPRNVSPKDLIKMLESCGFEHRRTKGSHAHYKRAGFRTFPIPLNQNPVAVHIVKTALAILDECREIDK